MELDQSNIESRNNQKINEELQEGIRENQQFNNNCYRIWEEIANQYRQEIEQIQNQMRQINFESIYNHSNGVPKQLMNKIKRMKMGKSTKVCSICFSNFQKDEIIMMLPCKHFYHIRCCKTWLIQNTKCPNCRYDVIDGLQQQNK